MMIKGPVAVALDEFRVPAAVSCELREMGDTTGR